jgi:hypothetical protein
MDIREGPAHDSELLRVRKDSARVSEIRGMKLCG